jgi:hypothetical protein
MGRTLLLTPATASLPGPGSPDLERCSLARERSSATLVTVNDVRQCPYCELRFVSRNELDDHIALEHPREVDDDTDEGPGRRGPD